MVAVTFGVTEQLLLERILQRGRVLSSHVGADHFLELLLGIGVLLASDDILAEELVDALISVDAERLPDFWRFRADEHTVGHGVEQGSKLFLHANVEPVLKEECRLGFEVDVHADLLRDGDQYCVEQTRRSF